MHKAVSVALPSGQRVTVPAYDYGAARSVRAKRVLVRSLDPLYCMEGIMPVLLAAAGYNTQHPHAPADYVCVLSEQAGTPQIGGLADMSTVVAYVIPPPDDPLLLRLPAKFVDYADKTTIFFFFGEERVTRSGSSDSTKARTGRTKQPSSTKANALQTTKPVTSSIKTKGRGKGDPLNGLTAQSKAANNSTTTAPGSTHCQEKKGQAQPT